MLRDRLFFATRGTPTTYSTGQKPESYRINHLPFLVSRGCQEQSTIMIRAVLMLLLAASASAFVVPAAPLKAVAPTRSLDECRRTTAPKAIIG